MPGGVIMSMSDRQRQGEDLVATHGHREKALVPRASARERVRWGCPIVALRRRTQRDNNASLVRI